MNPGKIAGANHIFGKPADWDESIKGSCAPLPTLNSPLPQGGSVLQSAWFPSPEEMEAMLQGCPVLLNVYGKNHPVVAIGVAPTPDAAEMMCDHGHTVAEGCAACGALVPAGARIEPDQVDPRLFVPGSRKKQ